MSLWTFLVKTFDEPVSAFTAILAVSTIVLAISTGALWWVTWRSGVRQSREMKILQRAYVSIEPDGIHLMKAGDSVIAHVAIKNAGNLPAKDLSWSISIKHSGSGEDTDFPLAATNGNIVLAPHAETTHGSGDKIIVQELLTACEANQNPALEKPLFIYVWGVVQYHDGFVAGRSTKFCHRYNWVNRVQYSIQKRYARQHRHDNATT